jgi:putative transposase
VSLFRFIAAEKANHSISLMCRLLGVSRSGFHAWQRRPLSDRALADAWLVEQITTIHRDSRGAYGARRIHAALAQHGIRVGRKRVERLMRTHRLTGAVPRKRAKTTIRVAGVRAASDLVLRDFKPSAANQLWVADIKDIPTGAGWLYLAAVVDCFSRRVVGWSMRDDLGAELVVDALELAVARRRPAPGLDHHSDQGSQYVSLLFGQRRREAASRSRSAAPPPTTTPSPKASSPRSPRICCVAGRYPAAPKHEPPSSTTSRPSTTRSDSTRHSTTCRRSTTKERKNNKPPNHPPSTKPGAVQRLQPPRLRRGPQRRESSDDRRLSHASSRLLQPARNQGRATPHRQSQRLPLNHPRDRLPSARHPPPAHPPLSTPDQRESRTLHPHPPERLGPRRDLPHKQRTHESP